MYEKPKIEILLFTLEDVLKVSYGGWEDWKDDNADPDGWA